MEINEDKDERLIAVGYLLLLCGERFIEQLLTEISKAVGRW